MSDAIDIRTRQAIAVEPVARQDGDQALNNGGGGGTSGSMDGRVSRLEAHMEHVREDMGEIKTALGSIAEKLNQLPTKGDLWAWKWQWTAIGFATMAIVIGGIIGGLSWIQPAPDRPSAPQPIVITLPKG